MRFLTDFADQAVILPVVLAIAAMLVVLRRPRAAAVWLAAIAVTFGVVLVLKLGFLACTPVFAPWSLRSPSGHAAAASVVAGGLATLLGCRPRFALGIAILAAIAIGVSRVALGLHSVLEVAFGAAIGIAGALALALLADRPPVARPVPLLAVVVVVFVLMHGIRLPAEAAIARAAVPLLNFVPACRQPPYARP